MGGDVEADPDGDEGWERAWGVGAVSFGGLEREGELGPGLALSQDDFLLLLLLPLTVLLQLHALLVNLSLLLHNTQLLLSLSHNTAGERGRSGQCKCIFLQTDLCAAKASLHH